MTESEIKQKLDKCQRLIADLTQHLRKAEALRDSLIMRLTDLEGAHDQRFAGVR